MNSVRFVHIYIDNGEGIFLQHRDDIPGIYDPNKLSAFGGHVDPEDPSFRWAARRELIEETGLDVSEDSLCLRGITRRRDCDLRGNPVRKIVRGYTLGMLGLKEFKCHEGQGAVFIPYSSDLSKFPLELADITLAELRRFYPGNFQLPANERMVA